MHLQEHSQSIVHFFNSLIEENKIKKVVYQDGQKDEVIFKDIYLYFNGINLQYFSLSRDEMCNSVYTDFQKIDKYTIEQIVEGDYDLDDLIKKKSSKKKEKDIRFFTVSQINREIKFLIEQAAF